jgi:hypothetical protein
MYSTILYVSIDNTLNPCYSIHSSLRGMSTDFPIMKREFLTGNQKTNESQRVRVLRDR